MRSIILSSIVLHLLSSCGSPNSSVEGFTTTKGPEGAVSKTLTDIKKIVTYGPSVSFNQLTGNPNDMALHPTTKLPAVAYQDDSSVISGTTALGGLKYAYMDKSGAWSVEVVDANFGTAVCGTAGSNCVGAPNAATGSVANIIALKFKSDGTPMIAYVFGASAAANKTVKVAERSDKGIWTLSTIPYSGYANVSVAATVDPIKSVTLTLDSKDRPHVTFAFYHTTATSSALIYSFRNNQGSWTTSAPNGGAIWPGGTIALGTGMQQSGSAICPLDSTLLTTTSVVASAAASTSRIMKCGLGTDESCGAVSWTNIAYPAAAALSANPAVIATLGSGRTDLSITSTNRVLISSVDGTTGIKFAISNETCDTALASMTWTASAAQIATASSGINGYEQVVAGNLLHVFFGTNSTSVNFAKANEDLSGGGLVVGNRVTAETVTVGLDGVSVAYDSTNDTLYGSYGALPAAAIGLVGNDLRVAFGPTADVVSTNAQGMVIANIDQVNRVFASNSIPNVSAAKAPNGTIGYTYFFQDFLPTNPAQTSKIYYGVKSGTATDPTFTTNIVANHVGAATTVYTGQYSSLVYDSKSNPVIAYHDLATSANGALLVSRSNNGGLSFASEHVDGLGAVAVGQFPSAAITTNDVLGVAYYDSSAANMRLKFARKKVNGPWLRYLIDGLAGTAGTNGCSGSIDSGKYAVLKFTSKGMPVIAYQANLVSQRSLRIAYAVEDTSSATYTWSCATVDVSSSNRGEGIDMVLDSADRPHIAHYDQTQGVVRYTTCATDIATCMTTGTTAFVSDRVAVTGTVSAGGSKPSIQVTAAGKVFMTYHFFGDSALALSSKAATDTAWTTEQIDTPSVVGAGFSALNGMNAAMVLNDSDSPLIFYRSFENWLKYFSREYL